jgi:hypothetical protein
LNLEVVYTNNKRKTAKTYSQKCESYSPVLTNPKNMKSEFVDFGLGENELVIDNKYVKVDGYPDMKVILCAGYKAHPNQLKKAFALTNNPVWCWFWRKNESISNTKLHKLWDGERHQ